MERVVATYGLRKAERLCGKAADSLFVKSKGGFIHPYRYVFKCRPATEEDRAEVSVLFAVPKRNIRKAVNRNLLKRRTREAYRTQKTALIEKCVERGLHVDIGLIYNTKEILDYKIVSHAVAEVLAKIMARL